MPRVLWGELQAGWALAGVAALGVDADAEVFTDSGSVMLGLDGDGQRAFDGFERAVQRQFSHDDELLQSVGVDLLRRRHDAHGDRQVVSRTLLADVGGRHVDDDFLVGETVAKVDNSRSNALLALLDCVVRQADQIEVDTSVDVHLNGDRDGFDANKGTAECLY